MGPAIGKYLFLLTLAGANAALFVQPLFAQPALPRVNCTPPQKAQTLLLNFTAASVPASPGATPSLHWVIDPLPTGEDVQVSGDPELKREIQDWVNDQNALDPKIRHPWVMDGRGTWTFFTSGLNRGLAADYTINPYPHAMVAAPSTGSQEAVKVPVTFCVSHAATLHLEKLEIEVISAGADPQKPRQQLNATLAEGVTAFAVLSEDDVKSGPETVLNAFSAVAEAAWQKTKQQKGIAIGSDAKDLDLRSAEASITALYDLRQSGIPADFSDHWPRGRGKFENARDGKCCALRVLNVQMASGAVLKVEAHLPASASPGQQKRAEKLAERSQDILAERFASTLASFRNRVPTFPQMDSVSSSLAASREIYPTVRPAVSEADHRNIVFETDNRWTILNVRVSAGAGYSAEEKGTGKLDLQAENLIFPTRDGLNPKQTESLNYAGGGEVQKATANWGLNWARAHARGAQSSFGPQLSGDYLQDHNQRFGDPTGPVLRDHEIGWEPSFGYSYTSAQVDTKDNPAASVFGLSGAAGIRQRWFRITPDTGDVFPPRSRGLVNAVFVDVTPAYHYIPTKLAHVGGVDVSAAAHFLRGLPAGDFTFTQVLVSAQATVFLGGAHPRDFFLRFRKGMGTSNGATPLFELFRLGGNDNTRGMEQGERIGREIAFEQSEAGVSARQIVSWVHRPRKAGPGDLPAMPSPIDLTKIYLKGFYDRGRVSDGGGFGDLFTFHHGASGYGAAVEIQALSAGNKRITLSIGYARSPDSRLHTSGVPITGATLEF